MTCYLHHSHFEAFEVTKLAGIFQILDWVAIEAEIQFNPSCITSRTMSERPRLSNKGAIGLQYPWSFHSLKRDFQLFCPGPGGIPQVDLYCERRTIMT
jgi:hypothetical protein